MELQRILTLTEKVAFLYTKYTHKYQLYCEGTEVSIDHETLGTLTIFCHQLKQSIKRLFAKPGWKIDACVNFLRA